MVGINYKDDSKKLSARSSRKPFHLNIVDQKGSWESIWAAVRLKVFDDRGIIRHKRIGDINERVWKEFKPLLADFH